MNKQLRKEWLKALRSGAFKQGEGQLQVGEHYCCLGVLCVVAEQLGIGKALRHGNGQLAGYDLNGHDSLLEVKAALKHNVPWVVNRRPANGCEEVPPTRSADNELVDMNDGGTEFAEIADWIEKYVPVDEEKAT